MDLILKELDGSRMVANVCALKPSQKFSDAFPEVLKHKEFFDVPLGMNGEYIYRYIALVYDKNSPLKSIYPNDINRAKSAAAELAGFKKNESDRFNELVEKMFVCQIGEINKMIVKYAVLSRSTIYVQYVVLSEVYQQESLNLLSGEKTKIDDFKKIAAELEDVKMEILNQDNNIRLEQSFVDFYIKDKLELRPEDIAKKLENGEPITRVKKAVSKD